MGDCNYKCTRFLFFKFSNLVTNLVSCSPSYDGLVAVPETAIRMVHSRLHGSPCESFSILIFIVRPSIWVVVVDRHLASGDGSSCAKLGQCVNVDTAVLVDEGI